MEQQGSLSTRWAGMFILAAFIVVIVAIIVSQAHIVSKDRKRKENEVHEGFDATIGDGLSPMQWSSIMRDYMDPILLSGYVKGDIDTGILMPDMDANASADAFRLRSRTRDQREMRPQYYTHKVTEVFSRPGRHEFQVPPDRKVEVLVVGGGGAGGVAASNSFGMGGGGGGGVVHIKNYVIPKSLGSMVQLQVGVGGRVSTRTRGGPGGNGQDSFFGEIIAHGGGGGGYFRLIGQDETRAELGKEGGSSGGNAAHSTTGFGTSRSGIGTALQSRSRWGDRTNIAYTLGHGNQGGKDVKGSGAGGGGGGAGSKGKSPTEQGVGGDGGAGYIVEIEPGTPVVYGGGGGGGAEWNLQSGRGGRGGGGNASRHKVDDADFQELMVVERAQPGEQNTGGGGGAMKNMDPRTGNGGSGIIMLRFAPYFNRTDNGKTLYLVNQIHEPLLTSDDLSSSSSSKRIKMDEDAPTPMSFKADYENWEDQPLDLYSRRKHKNSPFGYYLILHPDHPSMKYMFEIPREGEYSIKLMCYAPQDGGSSIRVKVNDDEFEDMQVPRTTDDPEWTTFGDVRNFEKGVISVEVKSNNLIGFFALKIDMRKQRWYRNEYWPGGDLPGTVANSVGSVNECTRLCDKHDRCKGFAFTEDDGTCELKGQLNSNEAEQKEGTHMWVRNV